MDHNPTSTPEHPAAARCRHHLHPFNDNAALAKKGTRILTRGEGCYVWDAEGNKLLDAFAGLWCVNIGYGRKELGEVASKQMTQLAYYNSFFQCTTEPTMQLAAKLAELTPGDLNHAFFTNSGSEANDTILRMVRHFWAVQDQPQKNIFIGRHNGYHGTTMAGASLGGMKGMHKQGGLPIPDIHHIDEPFWFADGGDLSPDEYGLVAARRLEAEDPGTRPGARRRVHRRADHGRDRRLHPADDLLARNRAHLPQVRRAAGRRRGDLRFRPHRRMVRSQYFGFQPDIMPIAKGITSGYIPLGAAMFNDRVAKVLAEQGGELAHGYTYSGHPVCAAVALENIRILQEEKIVEHAKTDIAPYLAQRWAELGEHRWSARPASPAWSARWSWCRTSPSGSSSPSAAGGRAVPRHALKHGLILRATWDAMLLSPPLIITRAQVDELFDKAWKALNDTAAEVGCDRPERSALVAASRPGCMMFRSGRSSSYGV
jgi:putrescine aminotransferase